MHILPGWLWLAMIVILLVIGIATQEAGAFIVVGASIALTVVIAVIKSAFSRHD